MSVLGDKQEKFMEMLAQLIVFGMANGYKMRGGDLWRNPGVTMTKTKTGKSYGHPRSLHRLKLAIDVNLFRDGNWLKKTEDHTLLGGFWESIGGTWGGHWGDGNHYSLEHEGMK